MANIRLVYGASVDITITLAGLTDGSARESAAIDNQVNLNEDALVYLAIKLQAGSPAGAKEIRIYAAASEDGTNYTYNATGADAAITISDNLRLLDIISVPDAGAITWKLVIGSVASVWGGILPPKWSIVVVNNTGITFDNTESNHTKKYRGVWHSVI